MKVFVSFLLLLFCSMANASSFCRTGPNGQGYVMGAYFMPSFANNDDSYCVLLWFEGWTLDTVGKYVLALVGVFFMGVANEFLVSIRRKYERETLFTYKEEIIRSAMYGLQMTSAYLMMLIVMLYEIYLFLVLVLGLATGHFLFNRPTNLYIKPCQCDTPTTPLMGRSDDSEGLHTIKRDSDSGDELFQQESGLMHRHPTGRSQDKNTTTNKNIPMVASCCGGSVSKPAKEVVLNDPETNSSGKAKMAGKVLVTANVTGGSPCCGGSYVG